MTAPAAADAAENRARIVQAARARIATGRAEAQRGRQASRRRPGHALPAFPDP